MSLRPCKGVHTTCKVLKGPRALLRHIAWEHAETRPTSTRLLCRMSRSGRTTNPDINGSCLSYVELTWSQAYGALLSVRLMVHHYVEPSHLFGVCPSISICPPTGDSIDQIHLLVLLEGRGTFMTLTMGRPLLECLWAALWPLWQLCSQSFLPFTETIGSSQIRRAGPVCQCWLMNSFFFVQEHEAIPHWALSRLCLSFINELPTHPALHDYIWVGGWNCTDQIKHTQICTSDRRPPAERSSSWSNCLFPWDTNHEEKLIDTWASRRKGLDVRPQIRLEKFEFVLFVLAQMKRKRAKETEISENLRAMASRDSRAHTPFKSDS